MATFGSSTADFAANFEQYGPTGSRTEVIANVASGYRLSVPTGGVTITRLRRGLIDNTAGGTVWVGVYDFSNGDLLGSANITLTTGGAGAYIWHEATGLTISVPDTVSDIFLATAQPTVDAWSTSETVTNGDSETDGSSQTLPDPFTGSDFTVAPPIQAEYVAGDGTGITQVDMAIITEGTFSADRNNVELPAGLQADDVIFCAWVTANAHTINSLSGFTQLGTTESADESMTVAYAVATGSEGSTISFPSLFAGSESGSTLCFAYRGLDTADLVEAVDQANLGVAGTAVSGPSVTPATDGCLVLQINGVDPGSPTMTEDTTPAAFKVFDGQDAGTFSYFGVQQYIQPTAAAIALDATFSESLRYITFQAALNAAPTGNTTEATTTVEILPETGWSYTAITTTTASTNEEDWSFGLTGLSTSDQLVTRDADSSFVTHNADGTSTVTGDGASKVFTWDDTDGTLTEIDIVYQASTGASIDSVDAQIRMGTTSAHTTSGFTGTIDDADINRGGAIEIEATSESSTSATWPAMSHGQIVPDFGTGATLRIRSS